MPGCAMIEFRVLKSEDAPEWWRLRLESLEGNPEAFSASAEDHRKLSIDEVKKRLGVGTSDSFVVGAFEDGQLVGMSGFHREIGLKSQHKGRIWGVYVTPAKRGTGVGRKLLKMILERVEKHHGVQQILISYSTTQKAAGVLYRSLGFKPFGCEPRALKVDEKFLDEEYMVLMLER